MVDARAKVGHKQGLGLHLVRTASYLATTLLPLQVEILGEFGKRGSRHRALGFGQQKCAGWDSNPRNTGDSAPGLFPH